MMKKELLSLPTPLLDSASYVSNTIESEYSYGMEIVDVKLYTLLKVASVAISLLLKQHSPIFSPDKEQLALLEYELSDEEVDSEDDIVDELDDAVSELTGDYLCYVDDTLHSLTQHGWEFKGEYYFSSCFYEKEKYPYENYKNSRLNAYEEYFDQLIKKQKYTDINTTAKIYVNKRLGKFNRYCLEHNLNNELTQEITAQVSKILQFWGIEYNLNRIAEDGFESVYIITDDYGYFPNNEQYAYAQADICLPIHAYNLEKLLDKAFELYPIEKERGTR